MASMIGEKGVVALLRVPLGLRAAAAVALAPWLLAAPVRGGTVTVAPPRSFIEAPLGVLDTNDCFGAQEETGMCGECFRKSDCQFGEWSEWAYAGGCTGICVRSREVAAAGDVSGKPCSGPTSESKSCADHESMSAPQCASQASGAQGGGAGGAESAPTSCAWGPWSGWGGCSRSCGGGQRGRHRQIQVLPKGGAPPCQPLHDAELGICNLQTCADQPECVDGQWGEWGPWQPCSMNCGAGVQRRSRRLVVAPSTCGRPALGSEHDLRNCEGQEVLTDSMESGAFLSRKTVAGCTGEQSSRVCRLNEWSPWSACPATCSGSKERVRRRGLEATTKTRFVQEGLEALERTRVLLDNEVHELRREKASALKDNSQLMSELQAVTTEFDRYKAQAAQAQMLEDQLEEKLETQTRNNDLLREKYGDLEVQLAYTEQRVAKEGALSHTGTVFGPKVHPEVLDGTAEDINARLQGLEAEAMKLHKRNVALEMSNQGLAIELAALHEKAGRLKLAVPTAIAAILIVAALGAGVSYTLLRNRSSNKDELLTTNVTRDVIRTAPMDMTNLPRRHPRRQTHFHRVDDEERSPVKGDNSPMAIERTQSMGTLLMSSVRSNGHLPRNRAESGSPKAGSPKAAQQGL